MTTPLRAQELIARANLLLDHGFHIMPGWAIIKSSDMADVLDRAHDAIPDDVKEAASILRRREELQYEAQARAERIIADAQAEAARILSEDALTKAVHEEAIKVREQIIVECEEVKRHTADEVQQIKAKAMEEAMQIKTGAEAYAEQLLGNLNNDLTQLQSIVRNGQIYLDKMKSESQQIYQTAPYDQYKYEENEEN
ncbi:hypothetical protein J6Q66_08555 [bacterium]|nr:hypothetical protein [bacterium]